MRFSLFALVLAGFLLPHSVFAQKKETTAETKVVSGSILLNDKTAPDFKAILAALRSDWKLRTDSLNIGDKTVVFSTPDATVMLAYLDYPVSAAEVRFAAEISWLWKNAETEAPKHQAQLVISVVGNGSRMLDLYKLFTKVAAGALGKTRALGIHLGSQHLLLTKGYFTETARTMSDESLPLYCWVYFGLLQENGKNSGYTHGLQEFGLQEMEVVQSELSLQDVHAKLYEATQYVVRYNVHLQDGQTVPTSEGQKIPVKRSNAVFLEGQTLKLIF